MYWFKYGYHDYMDERPGYGYQMFASEETAKDWVECMNPHYSGGYTWLIGPASQKEVLDYIERYKIEVDEKTLENINNPNNYLR